MRNLKRVINKSKQQVAPTLYIIIKAGATFFEAKRTCGPYPLFSINLKVIMFCHPNAKRSTHCEHYNH